MGQAKKPSHVVIMIGENDLYYAHYMSDATYGLDYSPGGLIENVQWMVAQCRSNSITPILATIVPNGGVESQTARWTAIKEYLQWLGTTMTWMGTSHATNTLSCALSDHWKIVYDTGNPSYPQWYPSGSTMSIDNLHPNAYACGIIATNLSAIITSL
jgi:lysophospholipase L1-like esterase